MLQWQVHVWMPTLLLLHRRSCGSHRFCLLLPEMHELEHCLQLWIVASLHAVFTRRQVLLLRFRSGKVKVQDCTKLGWQVSPSNASAFGIFT